MMWFDLIYGFIVIAYTYIVEYIYKNFIHPFILSYIFNTRLFQRSGSQGLAGAYPSCQLNFNNFYS